MLKMLKMTSYSNKMCLQSMRINQIILGHHQAKCFASKQDGVAVVLFRENVSIFMCQLCHWRYVFHLISNVK